LKFKVELDQSFEDGSLDTRNFKDLSYLTDKELVYLATFMEKVKDGVGLLGKNKPSWLSDEQEELPNTSSYKDGNYWHYHCGDFGTSKVKSITYNLALNIDGLTSPEVLHYIKEDDNSIVIVGYSPKHKPFPASDHPRYPNPLFEDIEE